MKTVSGKVEINWTVDIPDELQWTVNMCDDPAREAVIGFIPQSGSVYIWGEDKPPVEVFIEVNEDDIEIEEDGRDDR